MMPVALRVFVSALVCTVLMNSVVCPCDADKWLPCPGRMHLCGGRAGRCVLKQTAELIEAVSVLIELLGYVKCRCYCWSLKSLGMVLGSYLVTVSVLVVFGYPDIT
jgi:hypothetical protein